MSQAKDTALAPRLRIKDDLFSIDNISQYNLSLRKAAQIFQLGIFDTKIDRCLFLEEYELQGAALSAHLEQMTEIVRDHDFIQAGYWNKVCMVVQNREFVFIPEAYYQSSHQAAFLALNCEVNTGAVNLHAGLHRSQQTWCVFAMPRQLEDWVKQMYPGRDIIFRHNTGAFLEGLLKSPDKLDARYLHLLVNPELLSIAFFRNGNLQFINTFRYTTAKDFVYFVLLTAEELGISTDGIRVQVSANLLDTRPLLDELGKDIPQIRMAGRPRGVNVGYRFDELDEYRYFELLSSYHFTK